MAATNFAGLGERRPEARDEAILAFSGLLPGGRTRLRDTYLPNRVLQTGISPIPRRGAHLPHEIQTDARSKKASESPHMFG
jgi:hypothetical protein